jgi:hypothetical protein
VTCLNISLAVPDGQDVPEVSACLGGKNRGVERDWLWSSSEVVEYQSYCKANFKVPENRLFVASLPYEGTPLFGDVLRRPQVQPRSHQFQYYAGASQQLLHILHIIWARSYDKWKALSTIINVVSTAWPES